MKHKFLSQMDNEHCKTLVTARLSAWYKMEEVLQLTEFVREFQSAAEMLEHYKTSYELMSETYEEAGFGTLVFADEIK